MASSPLHRSGLSLWTNLLKWCILEDLLGCQRLAWSSRQSLHLYSTSNRGTKAFQSQVACLSRADWWSPCLPLPWTAASSPFRSSWHTTPLLFSCLQGCESFTRARLLRWHTQASLVSYALQALSRASLCRCLARSAWSRSAVCICFASLPFRPVFVGVHLCIDWTPLISPGSVLSNLWRGCGARWSFLSSPVEQLDVCSSL